MSGVVLDLRAEDEESRQRKQRQRAGGLVAVVTILMLLLFDKEAQPPQPLSLGDLETAAPSALEQIVGQSSSPSAIVVSNRGREPIRIVSVVASDTSAFRSIADRCSGTEIQPGGTCSVDVVFTPPGRGHFTSTWTVTDAAAQTHLVKVTGRGLLRHLVFSPDQMTFTPIAVGRMARLPLVLSNDGDVPIAVEELAIDSVEAPFAIESPGDCVDRVLAAGQKCTTQIVFQPQTAGPAAARLVARGTGGVEEASVAINSSANTAADLEFTSPDIPDQIIGQQSAPAPIVMTNRGQTAIRIVSVAPNDTSAFRSVADRCSGRDLPPQGTCSVDVVFRPPGRGNFTASWTITDEERKTYMVNVTGRGLLRHLALSPDEVTFPQLVVGKGATAAVTISNDGDVPVPVETLSIAPAESPFALDRRAGGCGVLAAGQTCTATIAFRPQTAGPSAARLLVRGPGGRDEASVGIRGSANAPSQLELTTAQFGDQLIGQRSAPAPIVVTNSGGAAIRIVSVAANDTSAFRSVADRCSGKELQPGRNCSIDVVFTPAGRGNFAATWTIVDEEGGRHAAKVSGRGLLRKLGVSRRNIPFPQVGIGSVSRTSLTITNEGDVPIVIAGLVVVPAGMPFTVRDGRTMGCSRVKLAAGQTCTTEIFFHPQRAGDFGARLVVQGAEGPEGTLPISGSALTPLVGELRADPNPVDMQRAEGRGGTVYITNVGKGPVEIVGSRLDFGGGAPWLAEKNDCVRRTLAPNGQCQVAINHIGHPGARARLIFAIRGAASPQFVIEILDGGKPNLIPDL